MQVITTGSSTQTTTTTPSPMHAAHWKMTALVMTAMPWCSPGTPAACPQPSSAMCARNRRKSACWDSSNLCCSQVRPQQSAHTNTLGLTIKHFCQRTLLAPVSNIQWHLYKFTHASWTLCEGHKSPVLFHRSLLSSLPLTCCHEKTHQARLKTKRTKSASGRRSSQFAVSRENCVWDSIFF